MEKGLEHYHIFEDSIDSDKFITYLKGNIEKSDAKDITLFCDNLRVHHSKKVQDFLKQINMECIFNVPYSPQFNPIEIYWAMVK